MDSNSALWALQILLSLVFVAAGYGHSAGYARSSADPRMAWMKALPPGLVRTIGVLEVAGGLGLILPDLTRVLSWLTPLAALCLAIVMVLAAGLHVRRREIPNAAFTAVLGAVVALLALGKFWLLRSDARTPRGHTGSVCPHPKGRK